MAVLLIDYGAGNLHSVDKAFRHVAGDMPVIVSADARSIAQADRIVLPGVGAFGDCIRSLRAADGVLEALHEAVQHRQRPFFGICVGMQMMLEQGQEHGVHDGLGWIRGTVEALAPTDSALKIPHMGWNDLQLHQPDHPALAGIASGQHTYFVHSYHARCTDPTDVLATVDYGQNVTALIGRDNLLGAQFHPEKSGQTGLALIANFLKM